MLSRNQSKNNSALSPAANPVVASDQRTRRLMNWKLVTALLILAVFAIMQSGCSTLDTLASSESVPPVSEPGKGMYMVDMVPLAGKQTSFKGKIRSNMTVQNVLEESGALKKIRNPKITVYRIIRGKGKPLKLPVPMQSGKRIVKFENDYSIHPGDRIVVKSNSGGLDNLMQSLLPQD